MKISELFVFSVTTVVISKTFKEQMIKKNLHFKKKAVTQKEARLKCPNPFQGE